MQGRRLGGWCAVMVGGVVALGAAVTACGDRPPPPVGAPAAEALASASPATPAPADSRSPVESPPVPPAKLRIDRLGLTARVDPVGVEADTGDFAVPPSVDVVGWYKYGPALNATTGSIVIAGHVDSAKQGGGAFFRLRELGPGDAVAVTGADGTVRRFTVVAREIYPKPQLPMDRLFARDGAARLTLITCGGPFDRGSGHYRDNVVITAEPGPNG
ncbi:class F sortase [Dactylosporangium sp. NPDC051541]|uniref:class F sortase n=1 Tax=Dactylosporangium sp. NPDC051541 TaxID=3363977 RepID=UPI0037BB1A67